jgi:hypothetical protein
MTLASFAVAPLGAQLGHRFPPRYTVGGSLLVAAAGMALMTQLDAGSSWFALVPGFIVGGLGMGVLGVVTSQAALGAVEPARAGMATGVVNTVRQVGVAAGVAVLGALFQSRAADAVTDRLAGSRLPVHTIADAVGSGAGVRVASAVPEPFRAVVAEAARAGGASGIDLLMTIGAIGGLLVGVAALLLIRTPAAPTPAAPAAVPADAPEPVPTAG